MEEDEILQEYTPLQEAEYQERENVYSHVHAGYILEMWKGCANAEAFSSRNVGMVKQIMANLK